MTSPVEFNGKIPLGRLALSPRAIVFGPKTTAVTRLARKGVGTRLGILINISNEVQVKQTNKHVTNHILRLNK